jgi:hypothetical protein
VTIRRTAERYADSDSCHRADGQRYMESLGGRGNVAVERTCMARGDLTSKPPSKAPILVSRFRFVGLQSGEQQVGRHVVSSAQTGRAPRRASMNDRTRSVRIFFVLSAFGVVSLFGMLSRPTFATIRGVDVVHLIGTGMCFGGAIVALVLYLRSSRG